MTMDWIVRKSKIFVIIFGILIVAGMLFIDSSFTFSNSSFKQTTELGLVGDEKISLNTFRQTLQSRNSPNASPLEQAQFRQSLFDQTVNSLLLKKAATHLQVHISGEEMWVFLEDKPLPGAEKDTNFWVDGAFSKDKYLNWLHSEPVLNSAMMQNVENQLKNEVLLQGRFQSLLSQLQFPTNLQKQFTEYGQEEKGSAYFYSFDLNSIADSSIVVSDQDIQGYYQTNQSQFHFDKPAAQVNYLKIKLSPSQEDTLAAYELIEDIRFKIEDGEDFGELAEIYSDDKGSASKSGSLGGFQKRGGWVKPFEEATFSLKPKQLSKPILTRFGVHLIRCNAVKGKGKNKQVDASHILIKIQPGINTVDDAIEELKKQKDIFTSTKDMQVFAKDNSHVIYEESGIFEKGDFLALGSYVSGFQSFAFNPNVELSSFSNILTDNNSEHIYLFYKNKYFKEGYNFERSQDSIKQVLIKQNKKAQLKNQLLEQKNQLKGLNAKNYPAKLKATKLDTIELSSASSWDDALGYNEPIKYQLLRQAKGQWETLETDKSVLLASVSRPISRFLDYSKKASKPLVKKPNDSQLLLNWLNFKQSQVKVINNLDIIYQN